MKNKKKFMIGAYSVGLTAIAVAIVIALNLFVAQLPAGVIRPDITPEKLATVGADSKKILDSVDTDITIYRVFSESYTYQASQDSERTIPLDTNLKNLLDKYADASSRITVKEIDPVENPQFLKKYTDANLNQNSLVVVSEKRSVCIDGSALYMYEIDGYDGQFYTYEDYYNMLMYDYYYGSGQGFTATEYFFGENEITGAIDYVNSDNIPVVYELSGHGEVSIANGAFGQMIVEENAEIKTLELLSEKTVAVPDDASAILVYAPSADLTAEERDALISYLDGGGSIILLSYHKSYNPEAMPNFASLTAHMGLEMVPGIVAESDSDHHYTDAPVSIRPVISGNGVSKVASQSSLYLWIDEAHGIKPVGDSDKISAVPLFTTTEKGYLYTDESAKNPESAEKSTYGLAYQSSVLDDEGKAGGTLYWFATPYFIYDGYRYYANGEVFGEILASTCEKVASVSIIGKPVVQTSLQITQQSSTIWEVVIIGVVPAIVLIAGFAVWYGRRKR
ncbi:MAG: hypothetical protein E7647_07295 [Ruminococcaceae bacterium]|nr:hypothetical protein [Oscillospiraceae bacterium]